MSSLFRTCLRASSVLLVALLFLAPAAAAAQWPGFQGGPRHAGQAEGTLPDTLAVLWEASLGGETLASPVIGAGLVFVGSTNGKLAALRVEDGREAWSVTLDQGVYGTPAYEGGRLYVTTSTFDGSQGGAFVLDAATGTKLATLRSGAGMHGGATVMAGTVFFGDASGWLHAFETTGLTHLWSFEASANSDPPEDEDDIYADDCCLAGAVTPKAIRGAPSVHKERVYFGALNHMLFAVDAAGRAGAETTDLHFIENLQDIAFASPSIDGQRDRLYMGSYDGRVYALSSEPGNSAETCAQDNRRVEHPYPYPCAKLFYWTYDTGSRVHSTAAIGEDLLFVGDNDGVLHAIWKGNGRQAWSLQTSDGIYGSPVVVGNVTLVGSYDGNLYMVRTSDDGRSILQTDTYAMPERIHASPAVAGGVVYVASVDGTLRAYGDPETASKPDPAATPDEADQPPVSTPVDGPPVLSLGPLQLDPGIPVLEEPLQVMVVVHNEGGAPPVAVEVVLYEGETRVATAEATVAAQGETKVRLTYTPTTEGATVLRVALDESDRSGDANKTDNERTKTTFVTASALEVSGADGDRSAEESGEAWPSLWASLLVLALLARRRLRS